ncbi:hypothetical protein JZ751_029173, partial [Albula glossodonta]
MSDGRRSAAALSTRAHAFSVEALIGTNKKRKLRGWEEKELELSMESLATNEHLEEVEDMAHCLDIEPDSEASPSSDGEGVADRTSCSFRSPVDLHPARCAPSPPSPMEDIQVELQCADLWKRFHDIGTEMIITKAGRRMFPAMRVKILGLDPHQQYYIAMDIVPVDNKRYRYVYHSSKWMVAGNADSPVPPRIYLHPDSLASGDTWMRQVISFDKLKLTNNELDDQGHDSSSQLSPTRPIPTGDGVRTFSFPETVFTTVTAYQNQQITRLKIDRNPFAKGFRDAGRNRTGLEAIMETYAFWRPPIRTLTFEDFSTMQKQHGVVSLKPEGIEASEQSAKEDKERNENGVSVIQRSQKSTGAKRLRITAGQVSRGGSTGSSPTASSTGTPSPSGHTHLQSPSGSARLLSPSPPAFHLSPGGFGVSCRESQLCSLGLPEYPPCARGPAPGPSLQGYSGLADASYGRPQTGSAVSAPPPDSYLPQRTSSLVAAVMQGPAHASLPSGACGKTDTYGGQLGSFPASQLQYMMQTGGGASHCSSSHGSSPGGHMFAGGSGHHSQQGSYGSFSLHSPYGLYGYGFPGSSRLSANTDKLSAPQGPSLPTSRYTERQYPPAGMDTTMHTIGSASGSQQGAMGCDARQYGAPSHMPVHM